MDTPPAADSPHTRAAQASIRLPLSLIALKGHPATGKSVLAHALAVRLHLPLIDKDDIKDALYTLPDANRLSYAVMWQVVATQLALGQSVVAVSPLSDPADYVRAGELATKFSANLWVVETLLAEQEWRRRLEARQPDESAHKVRGWAAMEAMLHSYAGRWQYPIAARHHLQVDTAQPVAASLEALLARILEKA